MKKSSFWMRGSASAICLTAGLGTAPAFAQDDYTGLLGDLGGLRPALGNYGVTLGLSDSENLLGNTTGGVKTGATLQGVATATLDIDTDKAFGWQGASIHISALQIHGRSFSQYYLDDLQAANGNEAEDATRLWEAWIDQAFDFGRADIKLGQQSIDNEFLVSTYSGLFINTAAGWPLLPSDDLYGGGPAYPLAALGARLQLKLLDNTTILAGVFDDNPGGGGFSDDAQALDNSGGRFNLDTGALFIAELQYAVNEPAVGQMVQPGAPPSSGLPGTYKIGIWADTGAFPDQRFGTDGRSLANPASNGNPAQHHGNFSVYAVADQTVWQSAADTSRSLNIFARIMGAPDTQNLIDFTLNGGVTLAAPLPGRDHDQAGIDFGLGKVSSRVSGLDRDADAYGTYASGVRGTEALLELTYQAQAADWLVLQPDLQLVFNPGGGTADPGQPARRLGTEFVAGARANITF